jgi:hypothetical protein
MSDYFDQLELELRAAVPLAIAERERSLDPSAAPPPRPPRRWRVGLGRAGIALSAVVAAAVVVVAITLAGRAHRAQAPTGIAHGQRPYGTLTLRQLLANFAVLRRAHDASDDPAPGVLARIGATPHQQDPTISVLSAGTNGARWVVRLARTLPDGTRVFLAALPVTGHRHGRDQPFAGGYELWQWNLGRSGGGGEAFGPRDYLLRGLDDGAPSHPELAGVVPDGVVGVRWTFCAGDRLACGGLQRAVQVRARASANVVAARVPPACRVTERCVTGVVWYGAGGHVVARFGSYVLQDLPAPPFIVPGSRTGPALAAPLSSRAAAILAGDGIVGRRFGASSSSTLLYAEEFAGLSSTGYVRGATCGLDHHATFSPSYLGTLLASPLTLYFRHGRFAGYQYGSGAPDAAVLPHQPSRLTTAAGLGIGDALARGRRLYGRAFRISAAQGGSWSVRMRSGTVSGYASGTRLDDRVTSIDAGDVGCPAVSP